MIWINSNRQSQYLINSKVVNFIPPISGEFHPSCTKVVTFIPLHPSWKDPSIESSRGTEEVLCRYSRTKAPEFLNSNLIRLLNSSSLWSPLSRSKGNALGFSSVFLWFSHQDLCGILCGWEISWGLENFGCNLLVVKIFADYFFFVVFFFSLKTLKCVKTLKFILSTSVTLEKITSIKLASFLAAIEFCSLEVIV